MPNVNAVNRLKTPPVLLKLDKENENKDVKRKSKVLHREKVFIPTSKLTQKPAEAPKETVWQRLSRVKKVESQEKVASLKACGSQQNLRSRSGHRIINGTIRQILVKRPLTPNTTGNKRNVCEKKSLRRLKLIQAVQEKEAAAAARGCSTYLGDNTKECKELKELLTARSVNPSMTSSDRKTSSQSPHSAASSRYYSQVSTTREEFPQIPKMDFEGIEESPRSLASSRYGRQVCDDTRKVPETHTMDFENIAQSEDEYELAPMITVPTISTLNSSMKIVNQFNNLLEKRQTHMTEEEVNMIKNVVKSDDRYRDVLKGSSSLLFKDILKCQLKEIVKQEAVVKLALNKIDSKEDVAATIAEVNILGRKEDKKPQVDVIFKNVPSLEKEIIILKALGEKLEATLQKTASQRASDSTNTNSSTVSTALSIPSSVLPISNRLRSKSSPYGQISCASQYSDQSTTFAKIQDNENTTTLVSMSKGSRRRSKSHEVMKICVSAATSTTHMKNSFDLVWDLSNLKEALIELYPMGVRQDLGFVNEFLIEHRSLVQLQEDVNRQFYLPTENENELHRTSFKKLKENPEVLLRHLKPKHSLVPFNVLDHDPIFFNSFLYNNKQFYKGGPNSFHNPSPVSSPTEAAAAASCVYRRAEPKKETSVAKIPLLIEGGDSCMGTLPYECEQEHEPLRIEEIPVQVEKPVPKEGVSELKAQVSKTSSLIKYEANAIKVHESKTSKLSKDDNDVIIVRHYERKKKARSAEQSSRTLSKAKTKPKSTPPPLPPPPEFVAPLRANQRRRIRRFNTPMPMDKDVDPKNSLFKTIMVGLLQISLFLMLIVAITYPDVRC